jgi:hypothetical protein
LPLDDSAEQAREDGKRCEDKRAMQRRRAGLSNREQQRKGNECCETREGQELSIAFLGRHTLARSKDKWERQGAREHRAKHADEQRIDLASSELGKDRRAAPHDHDREGDGDGNR